MSKVEQKVSIRKSETRKNAKSSTESQSREYSEDTGAPRTTLALIRAKIRLTRASMGVISTSD